MSILQRRRMMIDQGVAYDGIPLMITNVGDEPSVITLIPYGSFNAQIYYKKDDAKFYKKWNYNAITLQPNSTLSLFGDSDIFSSSSSDYANFSITGSSVKLSGRLASISHTSGVRYARYHKLFQNCTSVVEVSSDFLEGVNIPTTGYSGNLIFSYLFSNTGITKVPEGLFDFRKPVNNIYVCSNIYDHMFSDCKSLVSVPQNIFAKETFICQLQYRDMFSGCSSLTQAPDIYATNAPYASFNNMFKDCVSLENPPQILFNGYGGTQAFRLMFQGCTSLKQSPIMKDVIKDGEDWGQHREMFIGCSSLNRVEVSFTQWEIHYQNKSSIHTAEWLTNVSPTGTFICPKELGQALEGYYQSDGTWVEPTVSRGENTVPPGWYIDFPIIDARDGDANAMALMAVISQQTHADGTPWAANSLVMMKSEAEKVEDIGTIFAHGKCSATDYTCMQYFVNSNFPDSCFASSKLEKVILPNTLTIIQLGVFQNSNISSIKMPDSVVTILGAAFSGTKSLKSIDFNNVAKLDGYNHFLGSGLERIYIPKTLISIGNGSFRACNHLDSIIVEEGHPTYDSRENCNAVVQKSNNSLIVGCNTTIIPASVKSIGNSAFNSSQISYIDIPASVTSIGWGAFQNCKSLQTVILRKSTRYVISAADFQNVPATFYVPDELLDEYKAADVWSTLADRIKPLSEYTG